MKKLFLVAALAASFVASAFGGQEYDASFLNCKTLVCTNDVLSVSNLVSFSLANSLVSSSTTGYPTNTVGVVFTNYNDTQVVVSATTATSYNLLAEVDLPYMEMIHSRTNSTGTSASLDPVYKNLGIFIRSTAGADNATASKLVFEPVPDGVYGCPGVNEANCLTITVTPTGATEVRTFQPLDFANDCNKILVGCKKLRLRRVTNLDAAGARRWNILECKLVGLVKE